MMPAGHHSDYDSTLLPLPKSAITWFGGIFVRLRGKCLLGCWTTRGGEDVGSIVESILDKCNSASLSMANVNRAHRVGQSQSLRHSSQHGKPRARQIIVQFKDYDSKVEVMRSRKMLRNAMPNVYVNEDLTQVRSALLFNARASSQT